jgi:4-aminobutyrate aminotransferase-like enzyme
VLRIIEDERLISRVDALGRYLIDSLKGMAHRHPVIREVRGMGFMIGIELGDAAKNAVARLMERGIITNAAHDTVLRLLPPFIIGKEEIDTFLAALDDVLGEIESET